MVDASRVHAEACGDLGGVARALASQRVPIAIAVVTKPDVVEVRVRGCRIAAEVNTKPVLVQCDGGQEAFHVEDVFMLQDTVPVC